MQLDNLKSINNSNRYIHKFNDIKSSNNTKKIYDVKLINDIKKTTYIRDVHDYKIKYGFHNLHAIPKIIPVYKYPPSPLI